MTPTCFAGQGLGPGGSSTGRFKELSKRIDETKTRLERVYLLFFASLRTSLPEKELDLHHFVRSYIGNPISGTSKVGYGMFDEFKNGLICATNPPEPTLALKEGMVYYQKTPARIIFELSLLVKGQNIGTFVDMGSGLGQSAILFNLLTGTRCLVVEYEPAYHLYAIHCARQLGIDGIKFINADALAIDYPGEAVFYIFTSFHGSMLAEMLRILEQRAKGMQVRLFTYGPCSTVVSGESWLGCVTGNPLDPYCLCEFMSG